MPLGQVLGSRAKVGKVGKVMTFRIDTYSKVIIVVEVYAIINIIEVMETNAHTHVEGGSCS